MRLSAVSRFVASVGIGIKVDPVYFLATRGVMVVPSDPDSDSDSDPDFLPPTVVMIGTHPEA